MNDYEDILKDLNKSQDAIKRATEVLKNPLKVTMADASYALVNLFGAQSTLDNLEKNIKKYELEIKYSGYDGHDKA